MGCPWAMGWPMGLTASPPPAVPAVCLHARWRRSMEAKLANKPRWGEYRPFPKSNSGSTLSHFCSGLDIIVKVQGGFRIRLLSYESSPSRQESVCDLSLEGRAYFLRDPWSWVQLFIHYANLRYSDRHDFWKVVPCASLKGCSVQKSLSLVPLKSALCLARSARRNDIAWSLLFPLCQSLPPRNEQHHTCKRHQLRLCALCLAAMSFR